MSYALDYPIAERAPENVRASFIRRTYAHLAGAILAFVAIEFVIFSAFLNTTDKFDTFFGVFVQSPVSILIVFALFIGGSFLFRYWAHAAVSPAMQYIGLGAYVVLEALVFVPILAIATYYVNDPTIIPTAGILTLAIFAGLSISVLVTGKDFSFLGPILSLTCCLVFGLIIASMLFGFTLGLGFSFAMVAVASAFILYDTSNVLHHYRVDQHVGAALELFASIAMLFYYILRILIAVSDRR
jgi:FtsH-binding integral membrane protein